MKGVAIVMVFTISASLCSLLNASLIHRAVQERDYAKMESLLKEKPERVEYWDTAGMTPLHIAASMGDNKAIEILLKNGANPNAEDISNKTPIDAVIAYYKNPNVKYPGKAGWEKDTINYLLANGAKKTIGTTIYLNDVEMAKKLVEANPALPTKPCCMETNPLIFAAKCGSAEMAEMLISKGADPNYSGSGMSPIGSAIINGNLAVLKILLKNGVVINPKNRLDRSPLHIAARNGSLEIVKYLIDEGADVNFGEEKMKDTPLHYAAEGGNAPIIELLLEKGADIAAQNYSKETPLVRAIKFSKSDAIRVLISKEKEKTTYSAAFMGDIKAVEEFLKKDPSLINSEYIKGITPLYMAVIADQQETVKYLLGKGAKPDAIIIENETVISEAIRNGNIKMIKLLIDKGASVNFKSEVPYQGSTPLHAAAHIGRKDILEILLDSGADPNLWDSQRDYLPIEYAFNANNKEAAQLLAERGTNPNLMHKHEASILGYAIFHEFPTVALIMIEKDGDPLLGKINGKSPLEIAAMK
jgi:ankyrin repeat protein